MFLTNTDQINKNLLSWVTAYSPEFKTLALEYNRAQHFRGYTVVTTYSYLACAGIDATFKWYEHTSVARVLLAVSSTR